MHSNVRALFTIVGLAAVAYYLTKRKTDNPLGGVLATVALPPQTVPVLVDIVPADTGTSLQPPLTHPTTLVADGRSTADRPWHVRDEFGNQVVGADGAYLGTDPGIFNREVQAPWNNTPEYRAAVYAAEAQDALRPSALVGYAY